MPYIPFEKTLLSILYYLLLKFKCGFLDTASCTDMMIGASLSKPHIDHDDGPRARNNGVSVSMYHLPRVCCTRVSEIRVCPEMLRIIIDVLTCMIYNCE